MHGFNGISRQGNTMKHLVMSLRDEVAFFFVRCVFVSSLKVAKKWSEQKMLM